MQTDTLLLPIMQRNSKRPEPWLSRAAAGPGVRLHADTPRGPPPLTGRNPKVCSCTNRLNPAGREMGETKNVWYNGEMKKYNK